MSAGPARAASTVDVTYDLSDSSLFAIWIFSAIEKSNDFPANGTVSGTMQVRYTSNSSSGMPIQSGPASLRTLHLQIVDTNPYATFTNGQTANLHFTHTFNWRLTTPAAGSFTAGGALVGLSGNLLLTGRAQCSAACALRFQLPTGTIYPSFSRSGPFHVTGSAGPNSGALSTPHTLSGDAPLSVPFGAIAVVGSGWNLNATFFGTASPQIIVGREIRREAEGHPTRVIPEPGTLLLLGAGTAGLALVSRAARCSSKG